MPSPSVQFASRQASVVASEPADDSRAPAVNRSVVEPATQTSSSSRAASPADTPTGLVPVNAEIMRLRRELAHAQEREEQLRRERDDALATDSRSTPIVRLTEAGRVDGAARAIERIRDNSRFSVRVAVVSARTLATEHRLLPPTPFTNR
jgi:hypothetical protein